MTNKKTQKERALKDINELLGYYAQDTKTKTLSAQLGFMMGWLSRLAAEDWIIRNELENRLEDAKKKYSSSEDTLRPPDPRL